VTRGVSFDIDGESVVGKLYEPTLPARGQIVLVHGLLSQSLEFADAPAVLASRGWRVFALDQRGFGASGGKRGIITQERATADVLGAVAFLRREKPDLPVALIGHSMGAVFTLRALAADPSLRAAVLAAPMRTVRAEINSGEYAMYRVMHALSRVTSMTPVGPIRVPYKNTYDKLFHDKEAAERAKQNPFLHPTVDLTNVPSFLAMDGCEEAKRVKQPVLVLVGDFDQAVRRSSSMAVFDSLAGPKELATLPSGHSMWADSASGKAIDLVDEWMRKHLR